MGDYSYDSLNRLTQSKDGAGHHVSYGYDLAGNLTGLTYPDGSQVSRTYDAVNRLTSVKDWLGHTTSFAYDANSNLTTQTYPNSTTAAFSYDAADNLAQIIDSQAGTPVWTFGYTRDAYHQLATASDPIEAKTHTYSYDTLNRLTSDQGGSISGSWTLDAAGEVTKTQTAITQSYDAASELTGTQPRTPDTSCPVTSKPRSSTYSYNANGDRTQQTDTACGTVIASYGYDQADRLISLASGSTNATYAYNGDGLRMSKTVNGTAEAFSWDLAEGMPLILQDGTTKYLTGPGGLPIEQVDGSGTVLYSYQDQLGSTRGLRDASGNVAATFTYSAYGHQVGFSSNGATTPFGFAGQYTDAESGFQYLRSRYYDPSTTQFLTVDPLIGVTQQPYSYAGDNPANWVDPSGLCKTPFGNLPVGGNVNCSDDVGHAAKLSVHVALDIVAVPPYVDYYGSYYAIRMSNRWGRQHGSAALALTRAITGPLVVPEGYGLEADAGIDWIKGHTVNHETPCDEGVQGYLNPFHAFVPRSLEGPIAYLPGIHANGEVDWEQP